MELSQGSNDRLNLIQKEDLLKKKKPPGEATGKPLHRLIGRLSRIVDRVFSNLPFNHKTLKFGNQDRKNKTSLRERSTYDASGVLPCPVCGAAPHNLAIHDEWRLLPSAKSADKIAADREIIGNNGKGDSRSEILSAAGTGSMEGCGSCGSAAVFDNWLDINLCPKCGAHETATGWQER
jgi:hypothetical protein